ncbi:unnamed protein product [Wuchereria bancrofti]|uniref:Secreted protein n=1 Tax=Wuchereria bancrofti TaxID=6293 RepID=A0A3P7E9P6_WUCBA|nr:unnamed protein product [Wuchereria bancrofti]
MMLMVMVLTLMVTGMVHHRWEAEVVEAEFQEVDFSRAVPQVEVVVQEVEVVVEQRHLEVLNDQVMLPVVQHQSESLAVMISQLMLI